MIERCLDNLIYDKYMLMTEWQALRTTHQNVDKRLKIQHREDLQILNLLAYLQDKLKELEGKCSAFKKNANKAERDNKYYREQVEKILKKKKQKKGKT
mmetsp:Transcript_15578/g.15128  ORF Transcript_15578/g.15128 Transcript_15578/m.15128 type:complete len:98 (-) Transcript_15578:7-300(-)